MKKGCKRTQYGIPGLKECIPGLKECIQGSSNLGGHLPKAEVQSSLEKAQSQSTC